MSYGIGESLAPPEKVSHSLATHMVDFTWSLPTIGVEASSNDGQSRFSIVKYYTSDRSGPPGTPSRWPDIVSVQFGATVDVVHFHVAMLITTYSYIVYRGN